MDLNIFSKVLTFQLYGIATFIINILNLYAHVFITVRLTYKVTCIRESLVSHLQVTHKFLQATHKFLQATHKFLQEYLQVLASIKL